MSSQENNPSNTSSQEFQEFVAPKIGLPEYLRKETLKGLAPNQIAFFSPYVLKFDEATGDMYVDNQSEIKPENFKLPSYAKDKSKLAVMRIIAPGAEMPLVIDATGLEAGEINIEADLLYTNKEEGFSAGYIESQRDRYSKVGAIAFKNLEGVVELHGDPACFDALKYLIDEYQGMVNGDKPSPDVIGSPLVAQEVEVE